MKTVSCYGSLLVSVENARTLDTEAQSNWGFNAFALIEAAGRLCAQALVETYPGFFKNQPRITVTVGTGNNAADAMVMLRYFLLSSLTDASLATIVISRMPKDGETGPWVELLHSLQKMKVPVLAYNVDGDPAADDVFGRSDIILDGIAGTGLEGGLRGTVAEMVKAVNSSKASAIVGVFDGAHPLVVSVDLPSGASDQWEPGMPIVKADLTLAIEPQKYCLYAPAARPYAGLIVPVKEVFPRELIASCRGAELLEWENAREKINRIRQDAYKNERGTVEIRAGSPGATGAAIIAGRGAQAAGAGLIRLVVDDGIYPIIASRASSGIMVIPSGVPSESVPPPDAVLLGPGWGRTQSRAREFESALALEKGGVPLILDADAIELARGMVFSGNTIMTPHPGEFSRLTGLDKEELLRRPAPMLLDYSRKYSAVIIFKGHVITIAAPDGSLGVVDGMLPGLASGGSGDLLAGFTVGIAGRMARGGDFDAYVCASVAASLLIAAGKRLKARFTDPLEIASEAADLAGEAWLLLGVGNGEQKDDNIV